MKPFKVYAHPHGDYEAVESWWSWNACGVGPFRAPSKKMWAVGVGVLAALVVVWGGAATSLGTEHGTLIVNVGSVLSCEVFGAYGLQWHRTHLESGCGQPGTEGAWAIGYRAGMAIHGFKTDERHLPSHRNKV